MGYPCETCKFRTRAEAKPNGFLAMLWRWHTKFCPGWKGYQKHLAAQKAAEEGQG